MLSHFPPPLIRLIDIDVYFALKKKKSVSLCDICVSTQQEGKVKKLPVTGKTKILHVEPNLHRFF